MSLCARSVIVLLSLAATAYSARAFEPLPAVNGRDMRLTDVHGRVIKEILA